jgi:hypothetical protein
MLGYLRDAPPERLYASVVNDLLLKDERGSLIGRWGISCLKSALNRSLEKGGGVETD